VNQFQFVATIAEREVLRYTPAGIPIVSARLLHVSQQIEAKLDRRVELPLAKFQEDSTMPTSAGRTGFPVSSRARVATAKASYFM
jgi:hypothetical protein